MKEYVHNLGSSLKGAVIFTANDCRLKMLCHRVSPDPDAPVLGWEKLNPESKFHSTCEKEMPGGVSCYTMISERDGSEYKLYGPTHMHGKFLPAYTAQHNRNMIPGSVHMCTRKKSDGDYYTRVDATGMFVPCARALQTAYPGTVIKPYQNVDNVAHDIGKGASNKTHDNFLKAMSQFKGQYEFFAYCGHGVKKGLASPHIGAGNGWGEMVRYLGQILKPGGTIIFYACKTGLPEGFAQKISRHFAHSKVFAHSTSGPGDTNPDKVRINGGHPPESFEHLLGKEDFGRWKRYLKHSDLYLRYWWMTIDQIKAELNPQSSAKAA